MSKFHHHPPMQQSLKSIERDEEAEIFLELEGLSLEQRQLRVQEHLLRSVLRGNVLLRDNLQVSQANMGFLSQIALELQPPTPTSIQINFPKELPMPITLTVGQSVPVTATESDAKGTSVGITDEPALSWASSDPTIVSVGPTNADGSDAFTAVAVGTVTVSVTDPANGLTTTDTITVTDTATSIAINFGPPTP